VLPDKVINVGPRLYSIAIYTNTPLTTSGVRLLEAMFGKLGYSGDWKQVTAQQVFNVREEVGLIVLACGEEAVRQLGFEEKLGNIQGAGKWVGGAYVIPTFHPAQVAFSGATDQFDDVYETFQRAVRIAQGKLPPPMKTYDVAWELVTDLGQAYNRILEGMRNQQTRQDNLHIALDTESIAPNPQPRPMEDKWFLFQVCWGEKVGLAFEVNEASRSMLRTLITTNTWTWDMHNCSYDLQVCKANGLPVPKRVTDPMLLGLSMTEHETGIGLKVLSRNYLNAPFYEKELKESGFHFARGPQTEAQWNAVAKYGCFDAYNTWMLAEILPDLVKEEGTWQLYNETLLPAAITFSDLEPYGAAIDMEYNAGLEEAWLPILQEATERVQAFAAEKGFPTDPRVVGAQQKAIPCPECYVEGFRLGPDRKLWRAELDAAGFGDPSCKRCMKRRFILVPDDTLNLNSSQQMQHLCFDVLGMRMAGGRRSCDKSFWDYNPEHELTKMMGDFRERNHLLRNYIRGIGDDVWNDGRVHADFMLAGTQTGRLSIRNPPLQTLPKWGTSPEMSKLIRRMFVASPGHVIVDVDYKNLELFVAWHYSGDQNLARALTEQDFHTATAAAIFSKPYDEVTGHDRFMSKFVTFGIAYGRQAYSLAQGELKTITGGSETLAQMYIDRFWGLYPEYARVYREWQEKAVQNGELTTPLGRKRRWRLVSRDLLRRIQNQAVNFPIQSLASDTCLHALIRLNTLLPKLGLGHCLFTVHDSIVFEVPEDRVEEACRVIEKEMVTAPYETEVTFFVDIEVGPNLGEVTSLEKYLAARNSPKSNVE